MQKIFLQGNQAVALGALYAGCKFFAGYPITPSTEIAELLANKLPEKGGRFIQMEDEISAMAAIIGASAVGIKSLTATSGPGMSLKLENLGYAYMTEIPCVVVNVQRMGPSTGMPTAPAQSDIMQARWGTHGDHPAIVITPSTVKEQFEQTVRAFNLAEKYRIPVIILTDEIIGHMRETVTLPKEDEIPIFNRLKPENNFIDYLPYKDAFGDIPKMSIVGEGFRHHITGLSHDDSGFPTSNGKIAQEQIQRLERKLASSYDEIVDAEEYLCDDANIIIFAIGAVARSAKDAVDILRKKGLKVGLLKPLTIWPFPNKHIKKYASSINKILVAEMNLGQMITEVKNAVDGKCKVISLNRIDGEIITPSQLVNKISQEEI